MPDNFPAGSFWTGGACMQLQNIRFNTGEQIGVYQQRALLGNVVLLLIFLTVLMLVPGEW